MLNRSDIQNKEDIERMVNSFYDKVNKNSILSPLFNDVANVVWTKHLPIMYAFWGNILFGTGDYHGRPMPPHLALNQRKPLLEHHFSEWKRLFFQTIDELFEGPKAELAKARATHIAAVMQHKTAHMQQMA